MRVYKIDVVLVDRSEGVDRISVGVNADMPIGSSL